LDYFISTFTIWGAGSNCLFMYYHLFLHALLNLRILTLSISILDQSSSTLVFFFFKMSIDFSSWKIWTWKFYWNEQFMDKTIV